MMDAFVNFLQAALGMLIVLGVWAGWQWLVRKRSGKPDGEDVLEHMTHGCAGCTGSGSCHNGAAQERGTEVCSHERQ